jgi:hypothetical protein
MHTCPLSSVICLFKAKAHLCTPKMAEDALSAFSVSSHGVDQVKPCKKSHFSPLHQVSLWTWHVKIPEVLGLGSKNFGFKASLCRKWDSTWGITKAKRFGGVAQVEKCLSSRAGSWVQPPVLHQKTQKICNIWEQPKGDLITKDISEYQKCPATVLRSTRLVLDWSSSPL